MDVFPRRRGLRLLHHSAMSSCALMMTSLRSLSSGSVILARTILAHAISGSTTLLLSALVLSACAKTENPAAPVKPVEEKLNYEVERYFPAKDGYVYNYITVDLLSGEQGIMTQRYERSEAELLAIHGAGKARYYEINTSGVAFAGGGHLLRWPLKQDLSWKGSTGLVTVLSMDSEVSVPAGLFKRCILTEEITDTPQQHSKILSHFCPDVGLVEIEIEGESEEQNTHVKAQLKAFHPAIELAN